MQYSPNQLRLAVGSHEDLILIYDCENSYKLLTKLKGHSSFITGIDWNIGS